MAKTHPSRITGIINTLRAEYHRLTDRLGEIRVMFEQIGIDPHHAPRRRGPGRPKSTATAVSKPGRRRKRRRFTENAETFVLGVLKEKALTTTEVNAAWKASGRRGVANNTLTKLAKAKKIKRTAIKGGRGSKYSVA